MIFNVNVVMVINIAIHKAFISHDLVNKLFIDKMPLAKRTLFLVLLVFVKVHKFVKIKSKKGKA